tara:strand:- start:5018 stop:5410 length:393 start_codon:yes stop_codon:yes gene_type:complete
MTIEIVPRNNDEITMNEITTVTDRLPDLSRRQLAEAKSRTDWATWFWGAAKGYIYADESTGVTWQIVEEGKVRCIRIWDDDYCFENLAMMRATMEMVDLEVEIDPYAVISPFSAQPSEEATSDTSGVEVV